MKQAKCTSRPHEKAFLRTSTPENEKPAPKGWLCLVNYTGKISNLLEDLKKVERFMQYIENQGSENLTEIAESQE